MRYGIFRQNSRNNKVKLVGEYDIYRSNLRYVFKNKNGQMRSLNSVEIPHQILEKYIRDFKKEGYIKDYFIETERNKTSLRINLKYYERPSYQRN